MFAAGERQLADYTARLADFNPADYQIVVVNNSMAPYAPAEQRWQGVLHTATILTPDDRQRRVINSLMVASVPPGTPEPVGLAEQREFAETKLVRRAGYDKPELADDE